MNSGKNDVLGTLGCDSSAFDKLTIAETDLLVIVGETVQ